MATKRVLVTGGRDFNLPDEVHRILHPILTRWGIEELGQGEAEGADTLAKLWALSMGIPVACYEANDAEWKLWGNRAGNMRNSRMLRCFKPNMAVAFPGGNGTADMTTKLIEARVPTLVGRWTNTKRNEVRWHLRKGVYYG
jgi:hypothetical protein